MRARYSLATLLIAVACVGLALGIYRYFFPPAVYGLPTWGRSGVLLSAYALGRQYDVEITQEAIKKTPAWDRHHDNPPLSPGEAMIRADGLRLRYIREKKLSDKVHDGEWNIMAAELTPIDGIHWYWLVRFEYLMSQTGPPHEFLVPVLMDGTVVEPTTREMPAGGAF